METPYDNLTIHQKIMLKTVFTSKKVRESVGIKNHKSFDCRYALTLVGFTWKQVINEFLTEDVSYLNKDDSF